MTAEQWICAVICLVVLAFCINHISDYDTPRAVAKRRKKAIYRDIRRAGRR
jgi:hypothetical protein